MAGADDVVKAALKLIAGGEPQKTVKAYKLFRQKEGKLYPLFVDANEEVALGQWLKAKAGEQAASGKVKSKLGELAYRPGWHAGDLPIATHIGARSHKDPKLPPDTRPSEQVWAEVEMADDVDWQKVANERARITKKGTPDPKTAQITDQVPYGGYYRYKTNPNMTGNWLIGGDMRVNRVLTDDEVKAINDAAGVADLPRREGYGPGGWVDDVVKMAGKVISGEGEEATKAFRMPRVRPSTDNIHDVGSANFDYYDIVGNKTMPIKDVFGGVDLSMPDQRARVDALKAAMSDPEKGYISRIIVDDEGNVIEGQHRFDAFRELGASEIPVTMLRDRSRGVNVGALKSAIQRQGGIHPDQTSQIVDMILEGNPEDYEPPQGFEKWWNAGVNEYNRQRGRIAKGGGGGFLDDALRMAGKAIFGEGEDAAKAGIRAYHGSPHDFDRFDMSKIGTGEGAQAYGHGLYFAEHEPVAAGYRRSLAGPESMGTVTFDGKTLIDQGRPAEGWYDPSLGISDDLHARDLSVELLKHKGDIPSAVTAFRKKAEEDLYLANNVQNENYRQRAAKSAKAYSDFADFLEANPDRYGVKVPGSMYEVHINADPNAFLDWDKPLSEQPSLTRALGNYDPEYYVDYDEIIHKAMQSLQPVREPTGEDIYRALGHPKTATRMLNTMGVPGIRFLDAGSRVHDDTAIGMIKNYGSREKALEVAQKRLASAHHSDRASWQKTVDALSRPETRNLVVFDDKLISIIRKYGIAGASAMLGYNLMEQLDPKQALAASMADQDYQASRPQRSMGGNNSISGALNVARGLNGVK